MYSDDDICNLLFNFNDVIKKEYKRIFWFYLDEFEDEVKDKILLIKRDPFELKIKNEICLFNQIFFNYGSTAKYYKYGEKYFIKFPSVNREYGVLEREVFILDKLKGYKHFPKVIGHTEEFLVLSYCGERLETSNIPSNVYSQIEEIINALIKEEINHTDIKDEELLVKEGILYLVDFGWGKYRGRHDCGLNIPNFSLAENKFTDDKQTLIDIIERIVNPGLFLKKNKLLKNHKNVKWLGYKNMKSINR